MKIKHILSVLLCLLILCAAASLQASAETYSGSCGNGLKWSLNTATGELDIIKTGGTCEMTNFFYDTHYVNNGMLAPWYPYRNYIKNVYAGSAANIGDYAFFDCPNLQTVFFSNSTKKIGQYAFYKCTGLTTITIPDSVTSIGSNAFSGCKKMWQILLGNGLTSISSSLFRDCSNLPSVSIGNNVTSIGFSAFHGCTSLSRITIGKNVTSVGRSAFEGCDKIQNVYFTGTLSQWCAINFSESASNPITKAGNLYINDQILTSAVIPEGTAKINNYVFYGCKSITDVVIPGSVTSISEYAFSGCTNLTSFTVNDQNVEFSSDASGVLFNKTKNRLIQYPLGNPQTDYTIPDSVTSIGASAFYNCTALTNVTFGKNVTTIDRCAFSGCSSIEQITMGNCVNSIGDYAFFNCTGLKSIVISDTVSAFGQSVFKGCTSLESMTLPFVGLSGNVYDKRDAVFGAIFGYTTDYANSSGTVTQRNDPEHDGVGGYKNTRAYYYIPDSLRSITLTNCTSVPSGAFDHCSMLTEINIPDSVTCIGYGAFCGCTNLNDIRIPGNVTEIDGDAFSSCKSIANITIPDGVAEIKWGTFSGCENLKSLTIGSGIKQIERNAFFWCYGIKELIFNGTKAQWYAIEIERDGNEGLFLTSTNRIYTEEPLTLSDTTLQLRYKDYSKALSASVPVTWTSSDESVCTVDQYGNLFPIGNGTVTITAHSVYGEKTATCEIEVKYSIWQWLIRIILLGFIWY